MWYNITEFFFPSEVEAEKPKTRSRTRSENWLLVSKELNEALTDSEDGSENETKGSGSKKRNAAKRTKVNNPFAFYPLAVEDNPKSIEITRQESIYIDDRDAQNRHQDNLLALIKRKRKLNSDADQPSTSAIKFGPKNAAKRTKVDNSFPFALYPVLAGEDDPAESEFSTKSTKRVTIAEEVKTVHFAGKRKSEQKYLERLSVKHIPIHKQIASKKTNDAKKGYHSRSKYGGR